VATLPLLFFALVIFWLRSCIFALAGLRWQPSYLLCSWDYRCTTQCLSFHPGGVSLTFLPRLASNHSPPDLYHLSSWDYRHVWVTVLGLCYCIFNSKISTLFSFIFSVSLMIPCILIFVSRVFMNAHSKIKSFVRSSQHVNIVLLASLDCLFSHMLRLLCFCACLCPLEHVVF
jgi:hypothetical protein